VRKNPNAPLALDRLQQHAGGVWPDEGLDRFEIAEGSLVEPLDLGAETVEIFDVAARGERRERASVKGAFESDQR